MAILTALLLLFTVNANETLHAPHDSSYGIASALLANGDVVTAIVGSEQQVMVTRDGGYSWHIIAGEALQLANATSITYHPGLDSSNGLGAFVIGTDQGVWTFEPDNYFAVKTSFGLHSADRSILSIDSPSHGTDGPAVAVTKLGSVYALDTNTLSWSPVYQVTTSVHFATKIAIAPHASLNNSVNGDQDIFLAAFGLLHVSHDLGLSWSIAPDFSNPALGVFNWSITSIDVSDDYANDNTLMLGRGRLHPSGRWDEGDIWCSNDNATTFSRIYQLDTAVSALLSTPQDSNGKRYWLAAGRQYPNHNNYFGTGILRSEDGGYNWSDHSSAQDFLLEDGPGKKSGAEDMFNISQLQVSADFSQNDELMYARQEGLFISRNSGSHWQQQATRFANRLRDVEATIDANGHDLVFGAGYGTGTVMYNATSDNSEIVPSRSPMVYQRRISISPNFDLDGRLLVAGNVYLYEWQSADVAPSNPTLSTYWFEPQVNNVLANGKDAGYPRGVQYSPNFDPTGTTATADETFFWFSAQGQMRRTSDNGLTSERLFEDTLGAPTDRMQCVAIAPTYDASGSRTDVYAGTIGGIVYRLLDTQWLELFDFDNQIIKLVVDPSYRRPSNPTLFALSNKAPYVYKITDSLVAPLAQPLKYNLSGVLPTGIALNPNFKEEPIIYIATKACGAFQLHLSETNPQWVPFGSNRPLSAVDDICLSKSFATDGKAYLATTNGMMQLDSNNLWQDINGIFRLDDTDESISTYSPNNPNVIEPSHIWPWAKAARWNLPPRLEGTGDEIIVANYDDDYLTCPVRGTSVSVLTFQGPGLGEVLLELIDPDTTAIIASQNYDLSESAANASELIVGLSIPDPSKIYTFKVTAQLGQSERIVIDGIEVTLN